MREEREGREEKKGMEERERGRGVVSYKVCFLAEGC